MRRGIFSAALGLFTVAVLFNSAEAQQGRGVSWIWFNEGDPAQSAPAEARFFRRTFDLARFSDETSVDIAADRSFTLWVNGVQVGQGSDPKRVFRFDVNKHVGVGKNVIAVEAKGSGGPSGLLIRASYLPNGTSVVPLLSDASWKSSRTAADGWQKAEFDDGKWQPAKVLGSYGKVGPWKGLVWDAGGDDRFSVPPGFKVEQVIKENNSLINMCFDNKGRLLVSDEKGPILLCTAGDAKGDSTVPLNSVKVYCDQVKNCQGMCWVKDALLLVGNGPQGTGLYRVKDTDGDDKTDQVELLHRARGGMGEHGPHAIIHGPDDWLYLVFGNHAWAQIGPKTAPNPEKLAANSPLLRWPTGHFGPDQGNINTTEDVLLPRQNDARGHAANILAPGGTIWRLDHQGQNMSLVSAGYRNHYDASFNPLGELFTFDSDMEWDEALPWYRAVRVCHAIPGSDFVWRTGAANTPGYYIDSLPPLAETGRGSPVGTEFYDHHVFPAKYRGAYFMADWAIGTIFVVFPERDGASYKGKFERFCSGSPMNVTDLAVGPDGALYFTMGGRGTAGGVYRIVYTKSDNAVTSDQPQPLSAWGRAATQKRLDALIQKHGKDEVIRQLTSLKLADGKQLLNPLEMLTLRQNHGLQPDGAFLVNLTKAEHPELRAHAVWLLGVNAPANAPVAYAPGSPEAAALLKALHDQDALVRRRACEALIRAGMEPPVDLLWPMLADKDHWVATAARLVLQRIDTKKWVERLWREKDRRIVRQGIVALCKTDQAAAHAGDIFEFLHDGSPEDVNELIDHLRVIQLALIHTSERPGTIRGIALDLIDDFPHADWRVNRELAILLAYFRKEKVLDEPVHEKLLKAMLAADKDRLQQIHYFYCLRFLHDGWTTAQKDQLLTWFDGTKTWSGGASFTPFLENILRDAGPVFTAEDRLRAIGQVDTLPRAATVLLRTGSAKDVPPPKVLLDLFGKVAKRKPDPTSNEIKDFIINGLAMNDSGAAQAGLRTIADQDGSQRDAVAKALLKHPTPENWPYLVRGLQTSNPQLLTQVIQALRKSGIKPKPEDGAAFRHLLLASERLNPKQRWLVVELIRQWTGKSFGADNPEMWKEELTAWSKWFAQSYPKEPALPNLAADKPVESKWKFDELLAYLDKDPSGKGNASKGKAIFEKAQCIKCHKFGDSGEGVGPDLSDLRKRFKRADTLEALLFPSKVISDQYRSTTVVTKDGQAITGLAAPQGDLVSVVLQDASKVNFKKGDIEQLIASLVSVMPEKALDALSKEEIADLFAYLESDPPKK